MKDYTEKRLTVVTAILTKEKAGDILAAAVPPQLTTQVLTNARGTLYRNRWYHKLRPVISPEKTILETLVPESLSHALINNLSDAAALHDSGTGIVYSVHCEKALFQNADIVFPDIPKKGLEPLHYKHRLYAIHCITQKGKAENVSHAAIRAGAHGPIVSYGQGRGIRERMGLIRIAISPEKELIQVVVDHYNTEPVLEAMIRERLTN
jgi:nitrogen regulatory protein PII